MKLWLTATFLLLGCSISLAQTLVYEGSEGIGEGKHIVFIANDHEYRSEQTCPAMAKILAKQFGFKCTVLFGIDENGDIKAGSAPVPGMEALKDADLLFFFTRFMNLPDDQADLLVDYFERGGPAVGIRTSTHCFNGQQGKWAKLNFNYEGEDYRGGLGEQIFGNTWHKERGQSHYGTNHQTSARVTPIVSAAGHPILSGVDEIHSWCGAYKSQPPSDATPLVEVQVLKTLAPGGEADKEKPPVSGGWTRDFYIAPSGKKKDARVVYLSFGASEDLFDHHARRCLVNACLWSIGMEDKIKSDMNVALVGGFAPSPFTTGALFYEGVKPAEMASWDSQVMPAGKSLGGISNPKMVRKVVKAMQQRPQLKAKLAKLHPEFYGPNAKLPLLKKKSSKKKSNTTWNVTMEDDFEGRSELGVDYICKTAKLGGFVVKDGVLIGKQVKSDHGAVLRRKLDFSDMQFAFDFRFDDQPGYARFNVVFDDSNEQTVHAGHISRLSVSRKGITIQDDKTGFHNKEVRELRKLQNPTAEQKEEIARRLKGKSLKVTADLKDNHWHKMKVTIEGSVMIVMLDGKELGKLDSPGIDHSTRDRFGFTVSGKSSVHFDNWQVSLPKK